MEEDKYYYSPKQRVVLEEPEVEGLILDIGGGGEGVIGQLMGDKVIAIDLREDELEETDNDALKIVMDASDLRFLDKSFDMVTSFFSLMYIPDKLHQKVFQEVYRVLKEGSEFHIWEVEISEKDEEYEAFILSLEYSIRGNVTETGFGVRWREQDLNYYKDLAEKSGFNVINHKINGQIFHLILSK